MANVTLFGYAPINIFVDRNNTVYVPDPLYKRIIMWNASNTSPTFISNDLFDMESLYITLDGSIYGNNNGEGKIEKWNRNGTKDICTIEFDDGCYALFVDINNYIYCSMIYKYQVAKQSLASHGNLSIIVAGNGNSGAASDMLNEPYGIFVDINFDLYVADYRNNRIQLFKFGQLNGTTIAGRYSTPGINLYNPTGVFLDADHN